MVVTVYLLDQENTISGMVKMLPLGYHMHVHEQSKPSLTTLRVSLRVSIAINYLGNMQLYFRLSDFKDTLYKYRVSLKALSRFQIVFKALLTL